MYHNYLRPRIRRRPVVLYLSQILRKDLPPQPLGRRGFPLSPLAHPGLYIETQINEMNLVARWESPQVYLVHLLHSSYWK